MAMYVPDEINLTLYRILTGDQREFITKFTATQTALETFSAQLNPMVASIAQALADALEEAENTRQQAINDTAAIKNQTALIRDATDQIKADAAQIQTATQSIYDNEVVPARDATLDYRNQAASIRDQTQAISESGLPVQTGNDGKSLITNGETISWGVSVVNWISKAAAYTAEAGDKILADTSAGAFAIALPDNPKQGASVLFADPASNWKSENLTIDGNGNTIDGAATFAADVNKGYFVAIYDGAEWQIRFTGGTA